MCTNRMQSARRYWSNLNLISCCDCYLHTHTREPVAIQLPFAGGSNNECWQLTCNSGEISIIITNNNEQSASLSSVSYSGSKLTTEPKRERAAYESLLIEKKSERVCRLRVVRLVAICVVHRQDEGNGRPARGADR